MERGKQLNTFLAPFFLTSLLSSFPRYCKVLPIVSLDGSLKQHLSVYTDHNFSPYPTNSYTALMYCVDAVPAFAVINPFSLLFDSAFRYAGVYTGHAVMPLNAVMPSKFLIYTCIHGQREGTVTT